MIINLKKDMNGHFESVEVEKGYTAEELYFEYKKDIEFQIVAAKINNEMKSLKEILVEGDMVEFVDMRTKHGTSIYQHAVSLIFLKAAKDVLGDVKIEIDNSLNRGFYIKICDNVEIDEKVVKLIEASMKDMIDKDIPIREVEVDGVKKVELDGYYDYFYDVMVPSTGYIKLFELRQYKGALLLRFPHHSNPNVIPAYHDEENIYKIFKETDKWQKLLDIKCASDLNKKIREGYMREVIQLSEALHEKKIVEIAEEICNNNKRIILIAGPSSSGKTTFAQRLAIQLKVNGKHPLCLGTDDYFLNREDTPLDENGEKDFEGLCAVDVPLLNEHMNKLLEGETVDIPEYDFIDGIKKYGRRITKLPKGEPIIIEGIHGLNDELTKDIPENEKFKIYISPLTGLNIDIHNRIPTTDTRMLRRLVRDTRDRGKSVEYVIEEWPKVRKGEDVNIFPYSGEADAVFNSVHIYEVAVLKKYAEPLLKQVEKDASIYSEAHRLLKFLEFFDDFAEDELIVNNSILREFIGGSVFAK